MPIPEATIREAKEASDLLALCATYGLKLTPKGADYFARCPWHRDDTPSLSITPKKGLFHCFGCGAKGNAIQFVQKMESLSFPEAFTKVVQKNGKNPTATVTATAAPLTTAHLAKHQAATLESALQHMSAALEESPEALAYLVETRGLKALARRDTRQDLAIGYCPMTFGERFDAAQRRRLLDAGLLGEDGRPHFAGCVVFPLRDTHGALQGLYGRRIEGTGHVYLKGERRGVFGHPAGEAESVYLTESVIDALSLLDLGAPSVLALHGVNGWTPTHEAWLKAKAIRTLYLLLDGDRAGREASVKLTARLKEIGYACHILELPEGEDPNSFFSLAAKPRTLQDLQALPGFPRAAVHEPPRLKKDGDTYTATLPRRVYSITGLSAFGLDRLRVTIKCTKPQNPAAFHIDSLDLYVAKARAAFVDGVCKELGGSPEEIHQELKAFLPLLEAERLKMKDAPEEKPAPEMSETEKAEALAALKDPALVQNLMKGFEALGMIGEEKGKLLGYLGTVSRFLEMPLGALIVSRSGAGKTALQDALCSLVPEEALVKYTRLTGQALFYKEREGLKYKVLAIEEEDGMQQALYSIRTLASSQRLTVATTRSDPKTGKLKTDEYTVEGPVFIIIATTNPDALDAETRSRFIILTIDESQEQTRKIMEARKTAYTLAGRIKSMERRDFLTRYRNMQRLLRPLEVVNDYAPYLDYPFDRLQMRREFGKYMTLINSIALLHQHQRPIKTLSLGGRRSDYIEATVEDIALANELVLEFFPNALDELAPHTRRLSDEIGKLIEKKAGETRFTRKELRDFCGWTDWSIRQGLEQLCNLGYVGKVAGQNGVAFLYELLVDARAENRRNLFLTSVDDLKRRLSAAKKKKA